jgi:hypothetical protein
VQKYCEKEELPMHVPRGIEEMYTGLKLGSAEQLTAEE